MSNGVDLADQARRSRTSIVLLLFSAAAIYYSTQIHLNYGLRTWNLGIATVGVLFFLASIYTMHKDWKHETKYRNLLRRDKSAEVKTKEAELEEAKRRQRLKEQEKEEPASVREENEEFPIEE